MKPAPTRVLRIMTRLNIGGPAIHAGILSGGLDRARFRTLLVTGVASADEGDMSSRVLSPSARVVRLSALRRPIRPWRDLVAWWQLVTIIRRWRPAIVHTHMAKAGALGRTAAWVAGRTSRPRFRPVVLHTFHGHVLEGYFSRPAAWLFTLVERGLARLSDRLIAVSPSVRQDLVDRRVAPAERIEVIPLGLPLGSFLGVNGHRGFWRRSAPDGALVIAWVGRLAPIKRPELFLEALARLRQAHGVDARAIIAGDGALRPAVERAVARLGLSAVVQCAGWVERTDALYADADVVCLTSANEGTPVALIEALASGRPVVATAVGGVADVVGVAPDRARAIPAGSYVAGTGGWLARDGDAAGLAAALAACAQDADARRAAGASGRAWVRARYDAARLVEEVEALYDGWAAKRAGHESAAITRGRA